jgi:transposase
MLVFNQRSVMANRTILMSRIRQILRLYVQGSSKKKISVLTASSRNTVKKYIIKFIQDRLTYDMIEAMSDHALALLFGGEPLPPKDERFEQLQLLLPDIEKQLKRKGMTLTLLWEQYLAVHPQGYCIAQFYKHYRDFTGRIHPAMHMEHKAGDKVYIDFAGEKLSITDKETGEVRDIEVFAAILGCSQLTYVEAVYSQKKEELIRACENALHYFGGVPTAIVPDNLRSAVTKTSRYEPTINQSFASFAEHYNTVVLPARAYKPKDKALVEGVVKIIYRSIYLFVREQVYTTLEALNVAVQQALEVHNNTRFRGRAYSRRQQFEEIERASLQSLPVYRYEFKQQATVTVMKNGHVCLGADRHYYSVPYKYIGKKVRILFTSVSVEIFYHYECIASHARHQRKYHYTTLNEHLATTHRYVSDWTPEKFIEQGRAIHEDVAIYITAVIEHKQHPEQAYRSCSGILAMVRKAGAERLANACRRAYSYGVYNYPIILQILEKKMDHLEDDQQQPSLAMPQHRNIRGSEYYE